MKAFEWNLLDPIFDDVKKKKEKKRNKNDKLITPHGLFLNEVKKLISCSFSTVHEK